jgi:protein-S-isoprenylcysteine O-methyltransferase Ste14
MSLRVFLSIIIQYYIQIIAIDPNLGNEMGKSEGDVVNTKGNEHITAKYRIFHFTLSYLSLLLSLYFNLEVPLDMIDYFYFLIATIGVVGCFYTYRVLGEFYTFTIGIRKNHALITSSLYKYIMHPGYLFQLFIIISSICFHNVNYLITIFLVIYTLLSYQRRMVDEEKMLWNKFGDEFKSYKLTRKRLIPYLY